MMKDNMNTVDLQQVKIIYNQHTETNKLILQHTLGDNVYIDIGDRTMIEVLRTFGVDEE